MKLIKLNKEQLNNFLTEQKYSQFLQSYEWSEFQERAGQRVFRFGVEKEGKIIAVVSLIKKNIGAGKAYFYCPRFASLKSSITNYELRINVFNFIFEELKKLAQKENCLFLRFDPTDDSILPRPAGDDTSAVEEGRGEGASSQFNFRQTIDVQPSKTLILDLELSEETLLKEMHQKTRYNIRLAEKKGVMIREARIDEFDKFWVLMSETVERDGFRLHEKDYYKKMLFNNKEMGDNSLAPAGEGRGEGQSKSELQIKLFFAEYEDRVIAANIITFFGDMVTYVHGSSSDQDRNVMAPYLLQWEIIKQAKKLGYKHYDFYGIDEAKWPGVTRFKKGFGGQEQNYPGTFDVIFNNFSYRAYQTLRWLRRKF